MGMMDGSDGMRVIGYEEWEDGEGMGVMRCESRYGSNRIGVLG